jgi:flagellar hook-basal body complex protein FliE
MNPIPGISAIPQVMQSATSAVGNGVAAAASPTTATSAGAGEDSDFLKTLSGMVDEAGGMQEGAQAKVSELLQGNGQDIHSAMIAVEKADLSFQLMMQVRNKIIQAYQTISQMPF